MISSLGILLADPTPMYPNMYHPTKRELNYNFKGKAKYYTRTERPPRYILIDFGLSRRFDPASLPVLDDEPVVAGDKTAPEIFENGEPREVVEPFDPFPTDVYYVGNLIRLYILNVRLPSSVLYAILPAFPDHLALYWYRFSLSVNCGYGSRRSYQTSYHTSRYGPF